MRDLEPGDTFYYFTVERRIGQGLNGSVYEIVHQQTGDRFALKTMWAADAENQRKVAMPPAAPPQPTPPAVAHSRAPARAPKAAPSWLVVLAGVAIASVAAAGAVVWWTGRHPIPGPTEPPLLVAPAATAAATAAEVRLVPEEPASSTPAGPTSAQLPSPRSPGRTQR